MLIVVKTKIMSIGSIIGLIASAAVTFIMFPENHYMQIAVVIIACLGIFAHRENIKRLARGEENKLNIKKK